MFITIEPTEEMFDFPVKDGTTIPCRVWVGRTEGGIKIDAYVLSIVVPENATADLKKELPKFMVPSRERYATETHLAELQRKQFEERSRLLHETGWPGDDG